MLLGNRETSNARIISFDKFLLLTYDIIVQNALLLIIHNNVHMTDYFVI